jgi:3-oxoacyl-[acyl-carrier-protein] synthase-3
MRPGASQTEREHAVTTDHPTSRKPVYLVGHGICLPNPSVDNDRIEEVLGVVDGVPSRTKRRILKNNGIRTRHYAIDPATHDATHTNASMSAEAIRQALERSGASLDQIDCLACASSTPDQMIPSHGLMVQGELSAPACEVVTPAGVCASSMAALRYSAMSIAGGWIDLAVVCGSELASPFLRGSYLSQPAICDESELEENPWLAFNQDFLRWMLSDGAGAAVLSNRPRAGALNLRLDWVESRSFAGELETCMYWGAEKQADGSLVGWREVDHPSQAVKRGMLNLSQDVKLLAKEAGFSAINATLPGLLKKHSLRPDDVQWFLPHYSSQFFRKEVHDRLNEIDFPIPYDKWFTNLQSKGNTGSASIFIMLEELVDSGRLAEGERVLCFVPESARFTAAYALLTVVRAD